MSRFLTIPEKQIEVIDQMDEALALLRTAYIAASNPDWTSEDKWWESVTSAIYSGLLMMEPVREAVNSAHREDRI